SRRCKAKPSGCGPGGVYRGRSGRQRSPGYQPSISRCYSGDFPYQRYGTRQADAGIWSLLMRRIGFSSGAISFGDFTGALEILKGSTFSCVELSALRLQELEPLISALPNLDLSRYSYVS